MNFDNYINKIETLVKNINKPSKNEDLKNVTESDSSLKEFLKLFVIFTMDVIKYPLKLASNFIKNKVISEIKKDTKLYAIIFGIMGVLFVFFSVLWLFISVAVGIYFHQLGYSLLRCTVYSILFQLISFAVVGLIAFIISRNIKSLKLIKKLNR